MAIYKIFPEKDTTIYSRYPLQNTGLDEILELKNDYEIGISHNSRFLTQFSSIEINNIIDNVISGSVTDITGSLLTSSKEFTSDLRYFLAEAEGINTDTTVEVYPLSQSWDMGTGKSTHEPITTNGCSWNNRSTGVSWGESGGKYTNIITSQSLSYSDEKDLKLNVTPTIKEFYSGNLDNYGFLVKYSNSDELQVDRNKSFILKYFSIDTNTIYPPYLEFKWRDFTFNTGSSSNTIINTPNLLATLDNNGSNFRKDSIHKFYINCKPKFPTRVFQTSSLYNTNYYLPTSSYYAIKDLHTNEFVIDFDTTYTQMSADSKGSFFKLYMNGLQPERYYQILVKTEINESTLVLDDNYYFKVING